MLFQNTLHAIVIEIILLWLFKNTTILTLNFRIFAKIILVIFKIFSGHPLPTLFWTLFQYKLATLNMFKSFLYLSFETTLIIIWTFENLAFQLFLHDFIDASLVIVRFNIWARWTFLRLFRLPEIRNAFFAAQDIAIFSNAFLRVLDYETAYFASKVLNLFFKNILFSYLIFFLFI